MSNQTPRVRFAPSPTGHLHVGGARAAIFNWLFARHLNGAFLLRIEDTDRERSKPEYLQSILAALEWLGLASDEPPVIQSERLDEHKRLMQKLIDEGKAYKCYCSVQELESAKEQEIETGSVLKYPGTCRPENMGRKKELAGPDCSSKPEGGDECIEGYAIRFKLPFSSGPISWDDLVHGTITVDADQLDDFIIARSDGTPMYNFVVVADDAYMNISHIIRGEEHISNTPKQILLYQALGFAMPRFAHIPLILGPSGKKLSKRDNAVAVIDYQKEGYLPEALFNYLVRLGWSHGDQELFTRQELISLFALSDVNKKGAIFDLVKLNWVNSQYMHAADNAALYAELIKYVDSDLLQKAPLFKEPQLIELIGLYKKRCHTLKEIRDEIVNLNEPGTPSPAELQPFQTPETIALLEQFVARVESEPRQWPVVELTTLGKKLVASMNTKFPNLAQPIRIALTGKTAAPGVFELFNAIGTQESLKRIKQCIEHLSRTIE